MEQDSGAVKPGAEGEVQPRLSNTFTLGEEEPEVLHLLRDEKICNDLAQSGPPKVKTLVSLWQAIQEFRAEKDGVRRKNFLTSIYQRYLAGNESTRVEVSNIVLRGVESSLSSPSVVSSVLDAVEHEALAHLQQHLSEQREGRRTQAMRRARRWARGEGEGEGKWADEARKARQEAEGGKKEREKVQKWGRALVRALLSGEIVEDAEEHFAKMDQLDPLSEATLRRKGLVMSFLRTHRKVLKQEAVQSLTKTVSSFSLSEASTATKFNNAVEAFALGRSYNKVEKSEPDLSEVIHILGVFDGIKFDPVTRKFLLDAEHFFEASRVLNPESPRLFWYWALHYFWIAKLVCLPKHKDEANAFFFQSMKACETSIKLRPAYCKPLFLWGEVLTYYLQSKNDMEDVTPHLSAFTNAFFHQCQLEPFEYDLECMREIPKLLKSEKEKRIVTAFFKKLIAHGRNNRIRTDAAQLWLMLEQASYLSSSSLKELFKRANISFNDALDHIDAFVVLIRHEYGHKKVSQPPEVADAHHGDHKKPNEGEKAGSPRARPPEMNKQFRKLSAWMPNPGLSLDSQVKFENPRKIYHFKGVLATGGFGSVSFGYRKSDNLHVAIKENLRPLSEDSASVLAEIQLMRMCHNKYIVDLVDAYVYKDRCYIVMLYCDGGSLDFLLHSMMIHEPLIAHIFVRINHALAYLEKLCLVHRDVKPGNILLSRNGDIRLGDLGLMRPQVETQFSHSMAGTPFFRAPEVLLGKGAVTKSDVYSLGCALYSALYRAHPFAHVEVVKSLWKTTTVSGIPDAPPGNTVTPSPLLHDLMTKCFTLDVSKRPDASELESHNFFKLDNDTVAAEMKHICDTAFLADALENFGLY